MPSPSYKGLGESGAFGRNPGCLSPTLGDFTQLYGPQTTSIVEDFLKKDQFQPIRPFGPLRTPWGPRRRESPERDPGRPAARLPAVSDVPNPVRTSALDPPCAKCVHRGLARRGPNGLIG